MLHNPNIIKGITQTAINQFNKNWMWQMTQVLFSNKYKTCNICVRFVQFQSVGVRLSGGETWIYTALRPLVTAELLRIVAYICVCTLNIIWILAPRDGSLLL